MKTHLFRIITANIIAASLMVALTIPVSAQENQMTAEPTTVAQPETASTAEVDQKKRTERIAERKAVLKTKLTAAQQKRVQTRCKAAQGRINEAIKKATIVQQNRAKAHAGVVSRLTTFESKVSAQGVDTTDFKAQITTLQTKVATFNADLQLYTEAVNDTAALDCVADPTAFAASLAASRTALAKVRADTVAIRAHVNDTIKPLMVTVKTKLAAEATN